MKTTAITLAVYPTLFRRLEKLLHEKKSKKCNFRLAGDTSPCYTALVTCKGNNQSNQHEPMAPNQRAKDRKSLQLYIPVELYVALRRHAEQCGVTMASLITAYIAEQTKNVKLTEADYEEIRQWLSRP